MKTSAEDRCLKIALIGSLPPPIGGTSVSFEHLVAFLDKYDGVRAFVVDTSGIRAAGLKVLFRCLVLVFQIFKSACRADVVTVHVCTSSLPSFGLIVFCMCRLLGKPLIIRKFGGTDYLQKGCLSRKISQFVIQKADLYLAQTKQLVRIAREDGVSHVEWYPTSRPMPVVHGLQPSSAECCRRFVFLGQVRKAKGIHEIIHAGERFGEREDVVVDVYGTLDFDVVKESFSGLRKVRYCGMVQPEKVIETLNQYDALLLPSYHLGEGYPGVILEAYGAGLPVICTRWQALPEIVDRTTGILIKPKNAESLYFAMKRLMEDNELYFKLRKGVVQKRTDFSTEYWSQYFVHLCKEIVIN